MRALLGRLLGPSAALNLSRFGVGVVGQALTLMAMVLPIAVGRYDQLAVLVFVSGISSVASNTLTVAFPSLYPRLTDEREARIALISSLTLLILAIAGAEIVSVIAVISQGLARWSEVVISAAAMSFAQGLYIVATGVAVRRGSYTTITSGRLVYGIASLAATAVACFIPHILHAFVWAATLAFLCGAAWIFVSVNRGESVDRGGSGRHRIGVRELVAYWHRNFKATLSTLLAILSFQISALVLPALGPLRDAWTIVLRLTGGVGTVSLQLIAPALDIHLSSAVRDANCEGLRRTLRSELLLGVGLSIASSIGTLVILFQSAAMAELTRAELSGLVFSVLAYSAGVLSVSVAYNSLLLLGGDGRRLTWAVGKTLLAVGILIWGGHVTKLIAVAAVEFAGAAVYVALLAGAVRRRCNGFSWIGASRKSPASIT